MPNLVVPHIVVLELFHVGIFHGICAMSLVHPTRQSHAACQICTYVHTSIYKCAMRILQSVISLTIALSIFGGFRIQRSSLRNIHPTEEYYRLGWSTSRFGQVVSRHSAEACGCTYKYIWMYIVMCVSHLRIW